MRSVKRIVPAILFGALAAVGRAGSILYVDAAATGTHDGTTWTNAFADLPAALAAAASGDEIWVREGTYAPTAAADRTKSFALKNGVGIYGGFAGAETLRAQRDPATHATILSGEIGAAGSADNSYHVVTSDVGVTASAVLDGFTIVGGNATSGAAVPRGGGILVADGSPTFANLTISQNHADDRGGGMRIEAGAPTVASCRFLSNSSGVAGGGLSSASATSIPLTGSTFQGNTTGPARGGGIDANRVTARNCLIAGNSPNGVYIAQDGATFVNDTFTGNSGYAVFFNGATGNSIANSILYGDAVAEIALGFSAGVGVSFSDVQGGGFGPGPGNVDANPIFANAGGGDYRLGAGSPAVDAGSNAAAAGLTSDLAGLPRFFDDPDASDTGSGSAPLVDMGGFERVPLSVSAPAGAVVCAGAPASLSVTAAGVPTLTYGWRKGGVALVDAGPVTGTHTDTLSIDPTATGDSGSYDVVVTDGFGQQKASGAATLTVDAQPAAPTISAPKSVSVGGDGSGRERADARRLDLDVDARRRQHHLRPGNASNRVFGGTGRHADVSRGNRDRRGQLRVAAE